MTSKYHTKGDCPNNYVRALGGRVAAHWGGHNMPYAPSCPDEWVVTARHYLSDGRVTFDAYAFNSKKAAKHFVKVARANGWRCFTGLGNMPRSIRTSWHMTRG